MRVGIVLLTHPGIGSALINTAEKLIGALPLKTVSFEPDFGSDAQSELAAASAALRSVDTQGGVLILTDLYGATPARIAKALAQLGTPCRRVSGVNLPMLLRVMNYADQNLDGLTLTAASGGRNGVQCDDA